MEENSQPRLEAAGGTNGTLAFRVVGVLDFASVPDLFRQSIERFGAGGDVVLDLSGVTRANSAGLALLIEWRRLSHATGRSITVRNAPVALSNLARVSELQELLAL